VLLIGVLASIEQRTFRDVASTFGLDDKGLARARARFGLSSLHGTDPTTNWLLLGAAFQAEVQGRGFNTGRTTRQIGSTAKDVSAVRHRQREASCPPPLRESVSARGS
jgi:hypothetical protein